MYKFNYQRAYLVLKGDTPSEYGKKSAVSYAGKVSLVGVDDKNMPTRKIDKQDDLKWHSMDYFRSKALRGERIGLSNLSASSALKHGLERTCREL